MTRPASRRQHHRFCEVEGWADVSNARGKPAGHHLTFELELADGRVLRTRISRPANNDTYGPSHWSHILREQLDVTADQFWDCVDDGRLPPRPAAPGAAPAAGLPADLAYQLIHTLDLSEHAVAGMAKEEAIARMTEHWSRPRPG